ncbi:MAG TPA: response regulator, partial [Marinagarivorans sp.]|nr:response regulator [Marinagarivorans sp.]
MSKKIPQSPIKVLIADDSPVDRFILQTMLERLGYTVVLAEDGQQAIEQFLVEKPDLVFLDVLMPNVDGVEAASSI